MKNNYIPGSISFADGFMGPKGNVGFFMKYSHEKTKEIINGLLSKGRKITQASAGLDGDWVENNCTVFDGKDFIEYDVWDSSTWASPILIVDFSDGPSETHEVWTKEEKQG